MDKRFSNITHLFLDADDTLWENDIFFRQAEDEFVDLLSPWSDEPVIRETLCRRQEDNIPLFGYGSKTYMLGMTDTAMELCKDHFDAELYSRIRGIIVRLARHPFVFLDNAEDIVKALSERYRLVIATKGDLCEQNFKFHQSGLSKYVTRVEVMERKSKEDYMNLAEKVGVTPQDVVMVGNTVKSDIAPAVAIGGWGIYIPYKITWIHEIMPLPKSDRIIQLKELSELKDLFL